MSDMIAERHIASPNMFKTLEDGTVIKPNYEVRFWGIPCFFNEEHHWLWGTNWLFNQLIPLAVQFQFLMSLITMFILPGWSPEAGFKLKIVSRIMWPEDIPDSIKKILDIVSQTIRKN